MPIPARIQPAIDEIISYFREDMKLAPSLMSLFIEKIYDLPSVKGCPRTPTRADEVKMVVDVMEYAFTRPFSMPELGCSFRGAQSRVANEIARIQDLDLTFAFYAQSTQVHQRGRVNDNMLAKLACQMVFDIEGRKQLLIKAMAALDSLDKRLQPPLIADIISYTQFMAKQEISPAGVVALLERLPKSWQEYEIKKLVVCCDPEIKQLLTAKGLMPAATAERPRYTFG